MLLINYIKLILHIINFYNYIIPLIQYYLYIFLNFNNLNKLINVSHLNILHSKKQDIINFNLNILKNFNLKVLYKDLIKHLFPIVSNLIIKHSKSILVYISNLLIMVYCNNNYLHNNYCTINIFFKYIHFNLIFKHMNINLMEQLQHSIINMVHKILYLY